MELNQTQYFTNQFNLPINFPNEVKNIMPSTFLKNSEHQITDDSTDSHSTQNDTERSSELMTSNPIKEKLDDPKNSWSVRVERKKTAAKASKPLVLSSPSATILKSNIDLQNKISSVMNHKSVQEFFSETNLEGESQNVDYAKIKSNLVRTSQIKDLAAKTLVCSVYSTNYFSKSEPILGYLINFEIDKNNKKVPYVIPTLVSFKALPKPLKENLYNLEKYNSIVYKSKDKDFNYYAWLPIYITKAHYNDGYQILKNVLCKLAGINQEEVPMFSPSMINTVLLPLIKGLIFKIRDQEDSAEAQIQALGHLFKLAEELLRDHPKCYEMIDYEIMEFLDREDSKIKLQDILTNGLFAKMDLFSDELIGNLLRKILNSSLARISKMSHKNYHPDELVAILRKPVQIVLTFREAYIFLKNEAATEDLEDRYGILFQDRTKEFEKRISLFKKPEFCSLSALKAALPNFIDIKEIKGEFRAIIAKIETKSKK